MRWKAALLGSCAAFVLVASLFLGLVSAAGAATTGPVDKSISCGAPLGHSLAMAQPVAVDCGDGTTCPDGYSCCGTATRGACCPSDKPHWCRSINKCYRTFDDANAACGSDWEVCGVPVR